MVVWLFLLAAMAVCGAAPIGIVRGNLLDVAGSRAGGELRIETQHGDQVSCTYDAHTYIEMDGQPVYLSALRKGDRLEMIADRKPGLTSCYARTIRVAAEKADVNPGHYLPRFRLRSELIAPRGNLTFGAVVLRFNPQVLVVWRRGVGEQVILLRPDTRYIENGFPSSWAALAVNTRVFIRGGQNLENNLEAYQIIWGEIAGPRPDR